MNQQLHEQINSFPKLLARTVMFAAFIAPTKSEIFSLKKGNVAVSETPVHSQTLIMISEHCSVYICMYEGGFYL